MLNKLLVRDCRAQRWRTSGATQRQKLGFWGSIMQEHGSKKWKSGVTAWSKVWAGTGSSVLDPFPSVVVASLRAVDHRCCTPLRVKLPVVVEKVVKVERWWW